MGHYSGSGAPIAGVLSRLTFFSQGFYVIDIVLVADD
jgi:hypothetical protein